MDFPTEALPPAQCGSFSGQFLLASSPVPMRQAPPEETVEKIPFPQNRVSGPQASIRCNAAVQQGFVPGFSAECGNASPAGAMKPRRSQSLTYGQKHRKNLKRLSGCMEKNQNPNFFPVSKLTRRLPYERLRKAIWTTTVPLPCRSFPNNTGCRSSCWSPVLRCGAC